MLKHKRFATVIAGVAAAASLAALPGTANAGGVPASPANTITEGVGVPGLQLGMSRNQIVASYPNSYCASGPECYVPGAGGYTRIQFSNNTASLLEFTNADGYTGWHTSAGVTPTSTLAEVSAIYGAPVSGDTVNVPARGYSVKQIPTYNCGDSGCRANGFYLRHTVTSTAGGGGGGSTTTVGIQGSIVIRNTARSTFSGSVTVTVTDPSGRTAGTKQMQVRIPARGSVTIDPTTVINKATATPGTYSWAATTKSGRNVKVLDTGTFAAVAQ